MQKDKDIITYGYINEEHEKQITDGAAAINREARKDAVYFGRSNKPPLSESSIEPYIGRIRTGYEELRTKLLSIIKPEVHEVTFTRLREDKERKDAESDDAVRQLEHENQIAERDLTGVTRPSKPKKNYRSAIGLGIIYCSEFLLNSIAFEFLGGLPLFAYLIGLGVTLMTGILSFGIAKTQTLAETETRKPYLQLALLVLANLGIIVAMSVIRARAMAETEGGMPIGIFLAINIGFMVASIYFSKLFFVPKKLHDAEIQLDAKFEAVDERKRRIKTLREEKDAANKAFQKDEIAYMVVMSQCKRVCERIEAHYRETVELFKTENLIVRDDTGSPECFKQPVPPLTPVSLTNINTL